MDFEEKTLEFFVNRVSQGVAYTTLVGPVHVAVSLAGRGTQVTVDGRVEREQKLINQMVLYH